MEIKSDVKLGKGKYDWIAGGNSAVVHKVLLPDMNWKPYHLKHEVQFLNINKPYDTLFCVSFSANKIIGALFMYYLRNNLVPVETVKWLQANGYFQNGIINFNERFTAINGQTTKDGAFQFLVAQGIRNNGLIPQAMFPYANNFQNDINPKFITQEMKDLGQGLLERVKINYDWANSTDALKYSPLQGIVRYAQSNDPNAILSPTGKTNHAIEVVSKTATYDEIDDSYYQVYKRYAPNKVFSLLNYYLTFNTNMDIQKFVKDNDLKWVQNSNGGAFGRILQGKLFTFKTTDRGTLALLDDRVRKNGIHITDAEWEALPKENF